MTDAHHALATHEVVLLLETDIARGLTTEEAEDRRRRFGPNVLLAAAAVTLALGEVVDAGVILGVVVVNAVVGFVQESKAEAVLDALRSMVRTEARVRRDGHRRASPRGSARS